MRKSIKILALVLTFSVGGALYIYQQSPSLQIALNPKIRGPASVAPSTRLLSKAKGPLQVKIVNAADWGDLSEGQAFSLRVQVLAHVPMNNVRVSWQLPESGVALVGGNAEFVIPHLNPNQAHEFDVQLLNLSSNNRQLNLLVREEDYAENSYGALVSFDTQPSQNSKSWARLPTAKEKYKAHGIELTEEQDAYMNNKASKFVR